MLRRGEQGKSVQDSDIVRLLTSFRLENQDDHKTLMEKLDRASTDRQMMRDSHRELAAAVVKNTKWREETTEAMGLGKGAPSVWAANLASLVWWFPRRAGVLFLAMVYATVPEVRDILKQSAAQIAAAWKAWSP